jgi:hypothetical protein
MTNEEYLQESVDWRSRIDLRVVGVPQIQGHLGQELLEPEEQAGAASLRGR